MQKNRNSRIEKRLQQLRKKCGQNLAASSCDKQLRHITSDQKKNISLRRFFAGEIFWVEREGWTGCGGFYSNLSRTHHPGLVVQKCITPEQPVQMVPGTTSDRYAASHFKSTQLFEPEHEIKWTRKNTNHPEKQYYILFYRRPVARHLISFHLGNIEYKDLETLQSMLYKSDMSSRKDDIPS